MASNSERKRSSAARASAREGASVLVRELAEGRVFYLRFHVGGRRERVILHERPGCACGSGGGWDERAARSELGDVLARVRLGTY